MVNGGEAAVPNNVLGDIPEESLHQIHPGTGGRNEVDSYAVQAESFLLPLIPPLYPRFDLGVFVSAVIVCDNVQRQIRRGFSVELLQECQPLPMGMLRRSLTEYLPVQIRQPRKQRDCPMPFIVVRLGTPVAAHYRQDRLCALQCLALAFLVTAQYQRTIWRIQIQPDHIPEFLFKILVV